MLPWVPPPHLARLLLSSPGLGDGGEVTGGGRVGKIGWALL